MSNERDTKFAGFAKALWDEVLSKTPRYEEISLIGGFCISPRNSAFPTLSHLTAHYVP